MLSRFLLLTTIVVSQFVFELNLNGVLRAAEASPPELAKKIFAAVDIPGGLAVHLGCRDGQLTRLLGRDGQFTVHGLALSAEAVEAARKAIPANEYGWVSVERLTGKQLPYGENLINLIVVETDVVPEQEIMRVLAPKGVACFLEGDQIRTVVKPRPDDMDEWSHYLHDASNNPVAQDDYIGPPRSLRWIAPPLWLRSHETPSGIEGLVSASGKIFYFFDEGVIGITDQRLPERWSLICRDAFNGKQLWKRHLGSWGWPEWAQERFGKDNWTKIRGGRTVVPEENQRRLVADGRHLYATLSYEAPLSILDAGTGEVLFTIDETAPAREVLVENSTVVVYSSAQQAGKAARRGEPEGTPAFLTAVNGETGKILWRRDVAPIRNLQLAIDQGRLFFPAKDKLEALDLSSGKSLWSVAAPKGIRTVIAHSNVALVYAKNSVQAYDMTDGKQLWSQQVPASSGSENVDLFVAQGLVWRGMIPVTEDLEAAKKSADAMTVAFDLRTGEQKREIVVRGLRSPEHHHRCYRNKATERYIISGMEGAEFMDLDGSEHDQNNFLRGACKLGIMPCNGMIYVPADQCFCQPGAKLLGFAAVAAETPIKPIPDERRLEKGPAYNATAADQLHVGAEDWPTFRHDAARHGSTKAEVAAVVKPQWSVKLPAPLTAPIAVGNRLYVAARDAHTVYALDAQSGETVWSFSAQGRIDSPPTFHDGKLLFGSADGRVYCIRASDGQLAWRFLAAPVDRRIGYFDQIESAWPVHGAVLVHRGIAYATAGRSSYLDGGIRVYGLDANTGELLHQTVVAGPHREVGVDRDLAFFIEGANSDVLVCEGDFVYMRQKKFTLQLEEVPIPVHSNKGAQDVGLHVFSTASLIDGSFYNRAFWMYSQRWPGFQLAWQAPKAGQLLVVDENRTFAVKAYTLRNVHSPMFFPGEQGQLVFADRNTTEPQLVGEAGSKPALAWLPQSHIPREGNPGLDAEAFEKDKGIGYTRAEPAVWTSWLKTRVQAMVKAGDVLFLAGQPDVFDPKDPYASLDGRNGGVLAAISAVDGSQLTQIKLEQQPVFDGMIAAGGKLFVSLQDGSLVCLAP